MDKNFRSIVCAVATAAIAFSGTAVASAQGSSFGSSSAGGALPVAPAQTAPVAPAAPAAPSVPSTSTPSTQQPEIPPVTSPDSTAPTSPNTAAPTSPTAVAKIAQGQSVVLGVTHIPSEDINNPIVVERTACTVGFVDKVQRVAYVAGHCGEEGNTVTDRDTGRALGIFHLAYGPMYDFSKTWDQQAQQSTNKDLGYISLNADVQIADNTYSTNQTAKQAGIVNQAYALGREVCAYGYTSGVRCGVITDSSQYELLDSNVYQASFTSAHGDSGGPVWDKKTGAFLGNDVVNVNDSTSLFHAGWAK